MLLFGVLTTKTSPPPYCFAIKSSRNLSNNQSVLLYVSIVWDSPLFCFCLRLQQKYKYELANNKQAPLMKYYSRIKSYTNKGFLRMMIWKDCKPRLTLILSIPPSRKRRFLVEVMSNIHANTYNRTLLTGTKRIVPVPKSTMGYRKWRVQWWRWVKWV
jgi:hypothetical protein